MTAEGGRFLFFRKYQNKKKHREHKKIRDVDRVMVFEKRAFNKATANLSMCFGELFRPGPAPSV
ncbi:MAG: hypothetical protein JHD10_05190 [Sphingomonadaceae bacterium]|nr:hypothetical protein [Sphingomonadaceae bacterium]